MPLSNEEIEEIAALHADGAGMDVVGRVVLASAIFEAVAVSDAKKPVSAPPISREIKYLSRVFAPRLPGGRVGHARPRDIVVLLAGIAAVAYLLKHGMITAR